MGSERQMKRTGLQKHPKIILGNPQGTMAMGTGIAVAKQYGS